MEIIRFSECPQLFKSNLRFKDIKKIIKQKTGIKEENQKLHVHFDFLNFLYFYSSEEYFWEFFEMRIYGKSQYEAHLTKHFYEADVFLNLNKKVQELKQQVFEQTNVPINRQRFCLDGEEINDNSSLADVNLFEKKIIYRNYFSIK